MKTTKPKTPVVTVTLATGEQLKRATWRKYTHAVVLTAGASKPVALAWCGSHALAVKQLGYWAGDNFKRLKWRYAVSDPWELAILPVNGPATATLQPHQEGPEEGESLVDGWGDAETCECGRGAHECATADDADAAHGDRR